MSEIVARARACLGVRFRPHGRSVAHGLDCVGLAAEAFRIQAVPAGYALRGGSVAGIEAVIGAVGLVKGEAPETGDLLLCEAGPFQFHLAIMVPGGFVHADAGLRRVVEVPGRPRWPIVSCWRRG
jgi:murein DD-endopeptidase / murein LD-carboxypeptidase